MMVAEHQHLWRVTERWERGEVTTCAHHGCKAVIFTPRMEREVRREPDDV